MSKRPFKTMPCPQGTICGVCSGLAYYFGFSTWFVRFLFIAGLIFPNVPALIIYLILWVILDKWEEVPDDYNEITK